MLHYRRRLVWFIFGSCEDGPEDLQATLAQHSDSPLQRAHCFSVSVVVSSYIEPAPRLFIADKAVFSNVGSARASTFAKAVLRLRTCFFLLFFTVKIVLPGPLFGT